MKLHIASHAIVGVTGARVGTTYIYAREDVEPARFKPYFRFRNADCEVEYVRWSKAQRAGRSTLQREGE